MPSEVLGSLGLRTQTEQSAWAERNRTISLPVPSLKGRCLWAKRCGESLANIGEELVSDLPWEILVELKGPEPSISRVCA